MATIEAPYFPIIYVRGYAMTQDEIADTAATPYMGFNLGATKIRQNWESKIEQYFFESPLIRLMKEYGYADNYADGKIKTEKLPSKSIIIHRYYDEGDRDFGRGEPPSIEEAAEGLRELIARVKVQVCGDDAVAQAKFRVYLVAHSMGGLICRCFLQNTMFSASAERAMVEKVFTYATPHNGIEMLGVNVPRWLGTWDMDNFNRTRMAEYLSLPKGSSRVDSLDGKFDPARFFCLVGTNHKNYEAAMGLSKTFAGEMSDGLVRIDNAVVYGAPRAFVHRSHSGHFGIVNSEEGYQNLVRFLFGDMRVAGVLEVENLPLRPEIKKAYDADVRIRGSYYFECTVAPRSTMEVTLNERRKETCSAVLRRFDELFEKGGRHPYARSPKLFTLFLDSSKVAGSGDEHRNDPVLFSVKLTVSSTYFEIDGFLFDRHVPGQTLFDDTIFIHAKRAQGQWHVTYGLNSKVWPEGATEPVSQDAAGYYIPLADAKGFAAKLRFEVSSRE